MTRCYFSSSEHTLKPNKWVCCGDCEEKKKDIYAHCCLHSGKFCFWYQFFSSSSAAHAVSAVTFWRRQQHHPSCACVGGKGVIAESRRSWKVTVELYGTSTLNDGSSTQIWDAIMSSSLNIIMANSIYAFLATWFAYMETYASDHSSTYAAVKNLEGSHKSRIVSSALFAVSLKGKCMLCSLFTRCVVRRYDIDRSSFCKGLPDARYKHIWWRGIWTLSTRVANSARW